MKKLKALYILALVLAALVLAGAITSPVLFSPNCGNHVVPGRVQKVCTSDHTCATSTATPQVIYCGATPTPVKQP